MKLLHAPGALLLSLLLQPGPAVELAFTPEAGGSLGVSYEMVYEAELTGMERVTIVNGEENEDEVGEIAIMRKNVEVVEFTDSFLEVEGGRPVRVRRELGTLTMVETEEVTDAEGETSETVDEGESELAGAAVLFQWDEDEGEYSKSYAGEAIELDEDLLEKLALTGYLSECLTDEELEVGDTWELDAAHFSTMVAPGGDHRVVMESDPEGSGDEEAAEFRRQFEANLDGDMVAEFKGTRDEDGVRVAVVALTAELSSEVVLEQEINVNLNIDGGQESVEGTIVRTIDIHYDLEGELLWNLAAGHAVSFRLGGDTEVEIVESLRTGNDVIRLESRTTSTFEGTVTHRIDYD